MILRVFESSDAQAVGKGHIEHLPKLNPLEIECHLYIPPQVVTFERVITCVHGISRNALEQLLFYRHHADQLGLVLVVPLFDHEHFRNYQSLGFKNGYQRADFSFNRLLNTLACKFNTPALKTHLIGYSGGGQFAHRWAMGFAERLLSLHICSPGWYTFPSPKHAYPRGIKFPQGRPLGYHPDPQRLLDIPVQLLVGDQDTLRDRSLNTNKEIDAQQGRNRYVRAQNWFDTMHRFAAKQGRKWHAELEVMPDQSHSFSENMRVGNMGQRIVAFIQSRFPE